MIRLRKTGRPRSLEENAASWTAAYLAHLHAHTKPPDALVAHYREKDVKQAIIQETYGKCAYCESKVGHTSPGDVEHILPKSRRPELIFAWENLTYACNECNRRKGDYYSNEEPLVHPYDDNPEEHLYFSGPMIFDYPGDTKGLLTRSKLELNRERLVERRKECLEFLHKMVVLWAREPGPEAKAAIWKEIQGYAEDSAEFALMMRTYIKETRERTQTENTARTSQRQRQLDRGRPAPGD
jgi:uncharacterized protein (TIGR02646 family)